MENKVYIIESKRRGGGSYSTVYVHSTPEKAEEHLQTIVSKYGDENSWIDKNKIIVNIGGPVYYQIKEYILED